MSHRHTGNVHTHVCGTTLFIMPAVLGLLLFAASCEQVPMEPIGAHGPDTTSHDFVWDAMTMGYDHTSLYDAYAISDTDVWVGGDITEWARG